VIDWINKPFNPLRLTMAVNRAAALMRGGKPRILHVENDRIILKLVSGLLRDIAEVVHAVTLHEAQQRLAQDHFDLVILDLILPDGPGLEVLPHLGIPAPPVIIFSTGDAPAELPRNIFGVLVKSRTTNETLLETIRAALRQAVVA
ncbi:MAG: response regulator, partial [Gammaproteobacteria bacterium]